MEWRFGTVFVAIIGSFDPALTVKSFKTQTLFTKHPHSDYRSFLIIKDSPNRGRIEPIIKNLNGSRANLISHR